MELVVEISGLTKTFPKVRALAEVSCQVARGRVTAILGPNASGKTTLLKSILGLVIPDAGTIRVNGKAIDAAGVYREQIGYMPQITAFSDNYTVGGLTSLLRTLRSGSRVDNELFNAFNLDRLLKRPLKDLSGGTKQKVSAAIAFLFSPSIVILDEPTVGLDPVSSILLKEKILKERDRGTSIVLTSHVLSEVDELADDLLFLLEGKVLFAGACEELKRAFNQRNLERAIAELMSAGSATGERQYV